MKTEKMLKFHSEYIQYLNFVFFYLTTVVVIPFL